jgi:hypothetical protein
MTLEAMYAQIDFKFAYQDWTLCKKYLDAIQVDSKWIFCEGAMPSFANDIDVKYKDEHYSIHIMVNTNETITVTVFNQNEGKGICKYNSSFRTFSNIEFNQLLHDLKKNPLLDINIRNYLK